MSLSLTLKSSDGGLAEVSYAAAQMSGVIRGLLDSTVDAHSTPVVLDTVNTRALHKILAYCEFHAANPHYLRDKASKQAELCARTGADIREDEATDDEFSRAYARDLMDNTELLADVFNAAEFLDIPPLKHLLLYTIARAITGKSAQEMREILGLPNDLSPDEQQAIARANSWITDGI